MPEGLFSWLHSQSANKETHYHNYFRLAYDRGTYKPNLKLELDETKIEVLNTSAEVVVANPTKCYEMPAKKHGVCLIINMENFEKHDKREGAVRDEYNLIETWLYLGYHIDVHHDAKFVIIKRIFDSIDNYLEDMSTKRKEKLANDSFVCCILSHGEENILKTSDEYDIEITYLEDSLGKSKILKQKPKLLFIQACRGENYGAEMEQHSNSEAEILTITADKDGCQSDPKVSRSDLFLSFSTVKGNASFRDANRGSVYVRALCKTFCEESKQSTLHELQQAISRQVGDKVLINDKKTGVYHSQEPSCTGQLKKSVHFFYVSQ